MTLVYRWTKNTCVIFSSQDRFHRVTSTSIVVVRAIKDLLYNPYRFPESPLFCSPLKSLKTPHHASLFRPRVESFIAKDDKTRPFIVALRLPQAPLFLFHRGGREKQE